MSLKKILAILMIGCLYIACNNNLTKKEIETQKRDSLVNKINEESDEIFNSALLLINDTKFDINTDSIKNQFNKIKKDSAELGLKYSKEIKEYGFDLQFQMFDQIAEKDKEYQLRVEKQQKIWKESKAGKIQSKHPNWSVTDCQRLADKEIWIGMSLDMLKYLRGAPNSSNPSNYGNGVKWQWCWNNRSPSCFYGESDGIITAYN